MENKMRLFPDFGKRFSFPENFQIEYNGHCGSITNEIAVKMADQYEDFVITQIAMEARASGISEVTILNKKAIINALCKQIPKQVINQGACICPTCRHDMKGLRGFPDLEAPNYCPFCGQKLNWKG